MKTIKITRIQGYNFVLGVWNRRIWNLCFSGICSSHRTTTCELASTNCALDNADHPVDLLYCVSFKTVKFRYNNLMLLVTFSFWLRLQQSIDLNFLIRLHGLCRKHNDLNLLTNPNLQNKYSKKIKPATSLLMWQILNSNQLEELRKWVLVRSLKLFG